MILAKSMACEFIGTAFLLATVVGSGILAHKFDQGNIALTVLFVAIATGCVLYALIATLGSISAHFNPIVTGMNWLQRQISAGTAVCFMIAQVLGGCVGVISANLMFDLPAIAVSHTARTGSGQWLGEFIATFGLLMVIQGLSKFRPAAIPSTVAAYVAGAICFTSSTCFANPAVTISRVLTATITGIRVEDIVPFVIAQLVGAGFAISIGRWLFTDQTDRSQKLVQDNIAESLSDEMKHRELVGQRR